MQNVKLQQFEGPLELLLELIELEKLDISNIALSQVTEQYLSYLKHVSDTTPDELADFLVVASKLLLIKSRVLLPELVLPGEEEADLAMQLKMYKEYYDASKVLHASIVKKHFAYSRQKPAVPITPVFNPPHNLTAGALKDLFLGVLKDIEPIIELPKEVIRRAVSLHEKIQSIQKMIAEKATMQFSQLLHSAKSRMEVIVTFLALLELVKQRTVTLHQTALFDDISVESVNETV